MFTLYFAPDTCALASTSPLSTSERNTKSCVWISPEMSNGQLTTCVSTPKAACPPW